MTRYHFGASMYWVSRPPTYSLAILGALDQARARILASLVLGSSRTRPGWGGHCVTSNRGQVQAPVARLYVLWYPTACDSQNLRASQSSNSAAQPLQYFTASSETALDVFAWAFAPRATFLSKLHIQNIL